MPGLRVLVVEDSPHMAELVVEMLRRHGLEVAAVCATEDEAIAEVERAAVDVAIVDLQLAQGTGFGVIRAIRRARHVTAVIVLTAHNAPSLKVASFEAGADLFLDKARELFTLPDRVDEFVRAKGIKPIAAKLGEPSA